MSIQEQINQSVQALYVAFFDRAADAEGLAYWYNVAMDDGDDYIYQIADGFVSNPAFEDIYGGMNDEEFVKAIYLNVTNNDNIDADALAYWEGQVADNGRAHMVADFTQAVLSYDGTDADGQYRTAYLQAKVDAGLAFAGTLGDESNPTNPDNLSNDPAYIASQDIMSKFSTASDIAGIEAIKTEALDYIATHPTLGMWENQAPTINPTDAVVLNEDGEATGSVTASDVDNDYAGQTLTFFLGSAPANGTATVNEDGTFNYTPYENFNGTDSFEVIVNDGEGGTDTAVVNVTVNPVNDAPVAVDAALTTDEYQAVDGIVVATDVDGDALTYSLDVDASFGSVTMNQDGTFTYTPNGANPDGENYIDSFTYLVNDGNGGTDTATVSIDVLNTNDAPVFEKEALAVDLVEDAEVFGEVTATDLDLPNDTLKYDLTEGPANGYATVNEETGAFTYTPYENYNGTDSMTVTVTDADGATDTSVINFTINPVNDAPVAQDSDITTVQNMVVAGQAVATDIDNADDTLLYNVSVEASHGTVTMNNDGSFNYTPVGGYTGEDTFTYSVTDGELSDEGEITVQIDPAAQVLTPDVDHIDLSGSVIADVVTGKNHDLNSGDTVTGNGQTEVYLGLDDTVASWNGASLYSGFDFEAVNEFRVTNDRTTTWWTNTTTATFDLSSSGYIDNLTAENSLNDIVFEYADGKKDDTQDNAELTLNIINQTQPANVTLDIRDADTTGTEDLVHVHVTDSKTNAYEADLVVIDENVENIDFTTADAEQQIDIAHFVATGANSFVATSEQNVVIDTLTLKAGAIPFDTQANPEDATVADFTGVTNGAHVEIGMENDGTLLGSEGNDTLKALDDINLEIFGNGGNDTITTHDGNDYLHGGDGDDIIRTDGGDDSIWGDAGNDYIYITSNDLTGADTIKGGTGNDDLVISGTAPTDHAGLDSVSEVEDIVLSSAYVNYDFTILNGSDFDLDTTIRTVDATQAASVVLNASAVDGAGIEVLGSNGDDTFLGSSKNDIFDTRETDGLDAFEGGSGDDIFRTNGTNFSGEFFDGGEGTDTIEMYGETFTLEDPYGGNHQYVGTGIAQDVIVDLDDTIFSVEDVTLMDDKADYAKVNFDDTYSQQTININAQYIPGTNTEINNTRLVVHAEDNAPDATTGYDENVIVNSGNAGDYIHLGTATADEVYTHGGDDMIYFNKDGGLTSTDTVDGGDDTGFSVDMGLGVASNCSSIENYGATYAATGGDTLAMYESTITDGMFTNVTNVENLTDYDDVAGDNHDAAYDVTLGAEADEAGIVNVDMTGIQNALTLDASTGFDNDLRVLTDIITDADDNIQTGAGNDIVIAGLGDDTIATNDGNDIVVGMIDNNTVDLGAGDDMVVVDHTIGSAAAEQLDENDTVDGGEGNDTIKFVLEDASNLPTATSVTVADTVDLDKVTNVENYTFENRDEEDLSLLIRNTLIDQNMTLTFQNGNVTSVTDINVDMTGFVNPIDGVDSGDNLTMIIAGGTVEAGADVDQDYAFDITGSCGDDTLEKHNVTYNNDIVFNAGEGDDQFFFDGGDLGSTITYDGGNNSAVGFDTETWTMTGGDAVVLRDYNGTVDAVTDDDFTQTSNVEVLRTGDDTGSQDITLGKMAAAAGIVAIDSSAVTNTSGDNALEVSVSFDDQFANDLDIYMGKGDEKYDGNTLGYTGVMNVYAGAGELTADDTLAYAVNPDKNTLNLTADNGTADLTNVTNVHFIDVAASSSTSTATAGITLNTDALAWAESSAGADDGQALIVDAEDMSNAANTFTFDGTAEIDGDIIVLSGAGSDTITTGGGNDMILGGAGNDKLDGGDGIDIILGGEDDDTITGGAGEDALYGDNGADTIDGGDDADLITGGEGADEITGGKGGDEIILTDTDHATDTLVYNAQDESTTTQDDSDIITGFVSAEDMIDLTAIGTVTYTGEYSDDLAAINSFANDGTMQAALSQESGNLYIDVNGDGTIDSNNDMVITLDGVTDMDQDDFVV